MKCACCGEEMEQYRRKEKTISLVCRACGLTNSVIVDPDSPKWDHLRVWTFKDGITWNQRVNSVPLIKAWNGSIDWTKHPCIILLVSRWRGMRKNGGQLIPRPFDLLDDKIFATILWFNGACKKNIAGFDRPNNSSSVVNSSMRLVSTPWNVFSNNIIQRIK